MTGQETVESSLKDMLPEFLNAEIVLRTITDVSMAIKWLQSTFFYTRVRCTLGQQTQLHCLGMQLSASVCPCTPAMNLV